MRLGFDQNIAAANIPVLTEKHRVDWVLFGLLGALAAVGLVMVFSASVAQAERILEDATYYGRMQAIYLAIAFVAAVVTWRMPLDVLEEYGPALLCLGFLLLLLVLLPFIGKSVNGSRRWIQVGLSFQPSEFFKIAIIVYLAGFFVRRGAQIRTEKGVFLTPLGVAAIAAVLLLLEPDFGATVVICATVVVMMFVAGCRWLHFLLMMMVIIPLGILAILVSPYRTTRLMSFVNPWDDPFATDFQLTQSLIAVGRGSALLVTLFSLIVARCFKIARDADRAGLVFGSHIATGIGFWFGFQAFINIGANMGVLPTKGITLPLFSYGGR